MSLFEPEEITYRMGVGRVDAWKQPFWNGWRSTGAVHENTQVSNNVCELNGITPTSSAKGYWKWRSRPIAIKLNMVRLIGRFN